MSENKTKSKGISIALIILLIFLGFGFVIGIAQTKMPELSFVNVEDLENYIFNEEGVWVDYIGEETELVVPATYSLSDPVEMQMIDTNEYELTSRAERMGVEDYVIENLSGYTTDENGYEYYDYKYRMTFSYRKTIQGDDYTTLEVGEEIFRNDNSIVSVHLPDTITKIGSSCFAGAQSLKKINMPESLIEIENAVFFLCPALEEVVLPDSVNYISIQVFQNCWGLKSINIPKSLTYLQHWIFADTAITEITIPENVYGMAEGVFMDNPNLEIVNISEGLQYIGTSAFENCPSLKEIELPKSVKSIYNYAFANCTSFTGMTLNSDTVVTLRNTNALPENIEKIYVPDDLFESYLADGNWSYFSEKIAKISTKQ